MMYIDSHCHIHDGQFFTAEQAEQVYRRAVDAGVSMICVGTDEADSRAAAQFASTHDAAWAVVGVHPHDTINGVDDIGNLLADKPSRVVGIGEIGLDYHYNHSPQPAQTRALEQQLQWAADYDLPVSFHVREAFDDFWPIVDNFPSIRGVLHSFTDTMEHADRALSRGLFIGLNGICTFTKSSMQQAMFASLPLEKILIETDAPFLTPVPLRGNVNEPSYVVKVAEHIAASKSMPVGEVAAMTTDNARRLFDI